MKLKIKGGGNAVKNAVAAAAAKAKEEKEAEEKASGRESRAIDKEIQSAETRIIGECSKVLNEGIRKFVDNVGAELKAKVEGFIEKSFEQRIASVADAYLRHAAEVKELPYDTALPVLLEHSKAGWWVMAVRSPAPSGEKDCSGILLQRLLAHPARAKEAEEAEKASKAAKSAKTGKPAKRVKLKVRK